MGGRIHLESEYGVGTTMTVEVRLDKVADNAIASAASSSPASADTLKKEDVEILVVDDNELNRSICTRLLSKAGFSVESVGNGYDALEALARKRFDVVLMDNQMDGLDGLQTTIRIRQSDKPQVAQVKIIALTASALKGDRDAFLASGADGYLSKVSEPPPPPSPTFLCSGEGERTLTLSSSFLPFLPCSPSALPYSKPRSCAPSRRT